MGFMQDNFLDISDLDDSLYDSINKPLRRRVVDLHKLGRSFRTISELLMANFPPCYLDHSLSSSMVLVEIVAVGFVYNAALPIKLHV